MGYLQIVETSSQHLPKDMKGSIAYAKFTIFARDSDWASAEATLKALLRLNITFDMALDSVKTFLANCHSSDVTDNDPSHYYKILTNKFPK